jgi:hypothetical protein
VAVLRWVNLGLVVLLATLLVVELTRSTETGSAVPEVTHSAPVVVQETPSRRSRRMEAKLALEEARRQRREKLRGAPGPALLGEDGRPFMD